MTGLFEWSSRAAEGAPAVALVAALVWGALSIVLSPCHLASIPLIVGWISSRAEMDTRRAFWVSSCFALGILASIAIIGIVTSALGRVAGDLGAIGNYAVAAVFFLVGIHLLDVIPLPLSAPGNVNVRGSGLWSALLLGLIFGIALGPCTFAFMAPVLAVSFRVGGTAPVYAAGLLLAYGVGHCAVIAAAGTSAEAVQTYLKWDSRSRASGILRKVCGVLVLCGGLWMVYTAG